jgi:hypothetical protein
MTQLQANQTLNQINSQIKTTLNQMAVELGSYNKNILLAELENLWAIKRVLTNYIN